MRYWIKRLAVWLLLFWIIFLWVGTLYVGSACLRPL